MSGHGLTTAHRDTEQFPCNFSKFGEVNSFSALTQSDTLRDPDSRMPTLHAVTLVTSSTLRGCAVPLGLVVNIVVYVLYTRIAVIINQQPSFQYRRVDV
jgi:hypothetical protein